MLFMSVFRLTWRGRGQRSEFIRTRGRDWKQENGRRQQKIRVCFSTYLSICCSAAFAVCLATWFTSKRVCPLARVLVQRSKEALDLRYKSRGPSDGESERSRCCDVLSEEPVWRHLAPVWKKNKHLVKAKPLWLVLVLYKATCEWANLQFQPQIITHRFAGWMEKLMWKRLKYLISVLNEVCIPLINSL